MTAGKPTMPVCYTSCCTYLLNQSEPFVYSVLILWNLFQAVPGLCMNVLGGGGGGSPFFTLEAAMVH